MFLVQCSCLETPIKKNRVGGGEVHAFSASITFSGFSSIPKVRLLLYPHIFQLTLQFKVPVETALYELLGVSPDVSEGTQALPIQRRSF